jgi:hypothetical protein
MEPSECWEFFRFLSLTFLQIELSPPVEIFDVSVEAMNEVLTESARDSTEMMGEVALESKAPESDTQMQSEKSSTLESSYDDSFDYPKEEQEHHIDIYCPVSFDEEQEPSLEHIEECINQSEFICGKVGEYSDPFSEYFEKVPPEFNWSQYLPSFDNCAELFDKLKRYLIAKLFNFDLSLYNICLYGLCSREFDRLLRALTMSKTEHLKESS